MYISILVIAELTLRRERSSESELVLAADVKLENIKKLTEIKESNKSDTEMAFYNDNINGKTLEEIAEVFNETIDIEKIVDFFLVDETGDDGGIIALSGRATPKISDND